MLRCGWLAIWPGLPVCRTVVSSEEVYSPKNLTCVTEHLGQAFVQLLQPVKILSTGRVGNETSRYRRMLPA